MKSGALAKTPPENTSRVLEVGECWTKMLIPGSERVNILWSEETKIDLCGRNLSRMWRKNGILYAPNNIIKTEYRREGSWHVY